jgi:hypothetical protein
LHDFRQYDSAESDRTCRFMLHPSLHKIDPFQPHMDREAYCTPSYETGKADCDVPHGFARASIGAGSVQSGALRCSNHLGAQGSDACKSSIDQASAMRPRSREGDVRSSISRRGDHG